MTVSVDGVRIQKRPKGKGLLWVVIAAETILSLVVYVSLAAHFIWPETTRAAAGVSSMLSYEGRLMDSSGNPLGGTGTQYCFRFSIYDASAGGTKLWPAGTPATTLATSTDGVFTALVGQADALTYNFYDSDTTYLNVDVYTVAASGGTCTGGAWETLSPRQQVAATGYARSAENVYSALLFTDVTNGRVQVGTGTGGASPKFLGLDVKNTSDTVGNSCATSGTIWYNSAISKALVCENGTIQAISNAGALTTIAGITTNAAGAASTGTIVFSNSNGVTFGINGQTITASVNAGGAITAYSPMYPLGSTSQTQGALGATTNSAWFFPVNIPQAVQFNVLKIVESASWVSSTIAGSQTISSTFGLFSNNNGTLSLISSNTISLAISNSSVSATFSYANATSTSGYGYTSVGLTTTAQIQSSFGTNAYRVLGLQFRNSMSLPAGVYWLGLLQRQSTAGYAGGLSTALIGNSLNAALNSSLAGLGNVINTTNYTNRYPFAGLGVYTSTGSAGYGGTALPSSVFLSGIAHTASVMPMMTFVST